MSTLKSIRTLSLFIALALFGGLTNHVQASPDPEIAYAKLKSALITTQDAVARANASMAEYDAKLDDERNKARVIEERLEKNPALRDAEQQLQAIFAEVESIERSIREVEAGLPVLQSKLEEIRDATEAYNFIDLHRETTSALDQVSQLFDYAVACAEESAALKKEILQIMSLVNPAFPSVHD